MPTACPAALLFLFVCALLYGDRNIIWVGSREKRIVLLGGNGLCNFMRGFFSIDNNDGALSQTTAYFGAVLPKSQSPSAFAAE